MHHIYYINPLTYLCHDKKFMGLKPGSSTVVAQPWATCWYSLTSVKR